MKILILFLGLVWTTHADSIGNSQDLSSIKVCATLNNNYRTFANIWEIYNEYKTTGQLWIPIATNPCPTTYTDCLTINPVCAVSRDNFFKTFPNQCVLKAEEKVTGTAWNIVFDGVCSANPGDGFASSQSIPPAVQNSYSEPQNRDQMTTNSSTSSSSDNYNRHPQQIQPGQAQLPSFSLPIADTTQPQNNGRSNHNLLQNYANSLASPASVNSNQYSAQMPPEQEKLQSYSPAASLSDYKQDNLIHEPQASSGYFKMSQNSPGYPDGKEQAAVPSYVPLSDNAASSPVYKSSQKYQTLPQDRPVSPIAATYDQISAGTQSAPKPSGQYKPDTTQLESVSSNSPPSKSQYPIQAQNAQTSIPRQPLYSEKSDKILASGQYSKNALQMRTGSLISPVSNNSQPQPKEISLPSHSSSSYPGSQRYPSSSSINYDHNLGRVQPSPVGDTAQQPNLGNYNYNSAQVQPSPVVYAAQQSNIGNYNHNSAQVQPLPVWDAEQQSNIGNYNHNSVQVQSSPVGDAAQQTVTGNYNQNSAQVQPSPVADTVQQPNIGNYNYNSAQLEPSPVADTVQQPNIGNYNYNSVQVQPSPVGYAVQQSDIGYYYQNSAQVQSSPVGDTVQQPAIENYNQNSAQIQPSPVADNVQQHNIRNYNYNSVQVQPSPVGYAAQQSDIGNYNQNSAQVQPSPVGDAAHQSNIGNYNHNLAQVQQSPVADSVQKPNIGNYNYNSAQVQPSPVAYAVQQSDIGYYYQNSAQVQSSPVGDGAQQSNLRNHNHNSVLVQSSPVKDDDPQPTTRNYNRNSGPNSLTPISSNFNRISTQVQPDRTSKAFYLPSVYNPASLPVSRQYSLDLKQKPLSTYPAVSPPYNQDSAQVEIKQAPYSAPIVDATSPHVSSQFYQNSGQLQTKASPVYRENSSDYGLVQDQSAQSLTSLNARPYDADIAYRSPLLTNCERTSMQTQPKQAAYYVGEQSDENNIQAPSTHVEYEQPSPPSFSSTSKQNQKSPQPYSSTNEMIAKPQSESIIQASYSSPFNNAVQQSKPTCTAPSRGYDNEVSAQAQAEDTPPLSYSAPVPDTILPLASKQYSHNSAIQPTASATAQIYPQQAQQPVEAEIAASPNSESYSSAQEQSPSVPCATHSTNSVNYKATSSQVQPEQAQISSNGNPSGHYNSPLQQNSAAKYTESLSYILPSPSSAGQNNNLVQSPQVSPTYSAVSTHSQSYAHAQTEQVALPYYGHYSSVQEPQPPPVYAAPSATATNNGEVGVQDQSKHVSYSSNVLSSYNTGDSSIDEPYNLAHKQQLSSLYSETPQVSISYGQGPTQVEPEKTQLPSNASSCNNDYEQVKEDEALHSYIKSSYSPSNYNQLSASASPQELTPSILPLSNAVLYSASEQSKSVPQLLPSNPAGYNTGTNYDQGSYGQVQSESATSGQNTKDVANAHSESEPYTSSQQQAQQLGYQKSSYSALSEQSIDAQSYPPSNGYYNNDEQVSPVVAPCNNSDTYPSPVLESQSPPLPSDIYPETPIEKLYSVQNEYDSHDNKSKVYNDASNPYQNTRNESQTIYNGAVYQGPYYYEPKYKHINFGNFNFLPSQNLASVPVTSSEPALVSSKPSNAIPDGQNNRYHINPLEELLKQLQYIVSKKDTSRL